MSDSESPFRGFSTPRRRRSPVDAAVTARPRTAGSRSISASPTELGGDGGPGTNPEQLFALGYAACWQNAMIGIARRKGLDVLDSVVTATCRHRT